MSDVALVRQHIAPMGDVAIENVRRLENLAREMPQVAISTDHTLHAGMYARTVFVPAGVMITGVMIKIATLLIVHGDVVVYVEGGPMQLRGYTVLPASAGRKQAFVAQTDAWLTMVFPTDAKTVEEAERQFTDEIDRLSSRRDAGSNSTTITGE
jgi:hypothetical protein